MDHSVTYLRSLDIGISINKSERTGLDLLTSDQIVSSREALWKANCEMRDQLE